MKFSTKDRYALRLMTELAAMAPGELLPLKAVSDSQEISQKYLEQIVTPLARAGLVESVRGSQGGYRLAHPARQIPAGAAGGVPGQAGDGDQITLHRPQNVSGGDLPGRAD